MTASPHMNLQQLMDDGVSGAASFTTTFGGFELIGISDGYFLPWRDMIGSPSQHTGAHDALSAKYDPVRMPIGCFVLRGEQTVLIDTGFGPPGDILYEDSMVGGRLLSQLASLGLVPEDIEVVALSHLHIDHVGGLGDRATGAPVFPNAQVYLGAADWRYFVTERRAELPLEDHTRTALETLERSDQMNLLEGDASILPGLRRIHAPGHTPGHSVYEVRGGGERILLLGDAMYCAQQLEHLDWAPTYDIDPSEAFRTRERILHDLEQNGGQAVGCHFPELHRAPQPTNL